MDFKQAAEQIGDGLVAAYEADPREAIALITGLFVGLLEDAIRRGGGDPDRQIKVNSEGERDITVHVRGEPQRPGVALLEWAVGRWSAEVASRPLVNAHRRALDDAWRQVIRFAGGDPEALVGPPHDALLTMLPAGPGEG